MALIHEKLYRSETVARIDFGDYVASLSRDLLDSYDAGARQIRLTTAIAAVTLGLDTAIPCGLIINELITNSLKHAFRGRDFGEVRVEFQALPGGDYSLAVGDDGVGIPEDLRIEEAHSLGLRLVRTLTEQLGGRLTVESKCGTRFAIQFPATDES